MNIKIHTINTFINPKKIIFNRELFQITKIPSYYHIELYDIKTVNEFIEKVLLFNQHPNANPETGELCIPKLLKKHKVTEQSKNIIHSILDCFNLDDCYFTPWDEITYKKQESY